MSAGRASKVLTQHLVTDSSMKVLAQEGMPSHLIPNEQLRSIYIWAMNYYERNGMRQAPSVEALLEHFLNHLSDNEVDLDEEPQDTVEWAIDTLKSQYIYRKGQDFITEFAQELAEDEHNRPDVLAEHASKLVLLSTEMDRRAQKSDLREDFGLRLAEYEARKAAKESFHGMRMGLGEVDRHTNGIHDGELCVLAAGPKTGKSYFVAHSALKEWESGRVPLIFTLENSVEMMENRIACLMARVDSRSWQRGTCTPDEEARVAVALQTMEQSDHPFYVFQPDLGSRSFEHMVAEAQVRDVDSIYIDQLTFVELSAGDDRRPRHERIGDALHRLKVMISTGRKRFPVMLAHQINREGVKSANKTGYLEMFHLAEASEVERTADWVFGLYASHDDKTAFRIKLQTLATRREAIENWELAWNVALGHIRVRSTFTLAS